MLPFYSSQLDRMLPTSVLTTVLAHFRECRGGNHDPTARGFIGVIFRIQAYGSHAESIYLRPTNARAENQLNRNHSV